LHCKKSAAVAYYRTSSAANVGPDKDSQRRQAEAVEAFAKCRHELVEAFYDAAVELAALGHVRPSGRPYHAGSVRHMLTA
jgi:hypothetical protein